MYFIGAGQCNAVFGIPNSFFALNPNRSEINLGHALSSDDCRDQPVACNTEKDELKRGEEKWSAQEICYVAGRLSPHQHPTECATCLAALQLYTGEHMPYVINAAQRAAFLVCLSQEPRAKTLSFRDELIVLLQDFSRRVELVLMPNFLVSPLQLLHPILEEECSAGGSLTIELKPKSAWRCPRVIGIEFHTPEKTLDGIDLPKVVYVHPSKRCVCRYSQMVYLKLAKQQAGGRITTMDEEPPSYSIKTQESGQNGQNLSFHKEPMDGLPPMYCPNYLFRSDLSTLEGLRRLRARPVNNLNVFRAGARSEASSLGNEECDMLATTLECSGVLPILESLQLSGSVSNGVTERSRADSDMGDEITDVLDIELLYAWSRVSDKTQVSWLICCEDKDAMTEECDAVPTSHLECQCGEVSRYVGMSSDAGRESLDRKAQTHRVLKPLPTSYCIRRVKPSLSFEESVARFHVSTTARDVSIMISASRIWTPSPLPSENLHFLPLSSTLGARRLTTTTATEVKVKVDGPLPWKLPLHFYAAPSPPFEPPALRKGMETTEEPDTSTRSSWYCCFVGVVDVDHKGDRKSLEYYYKRDKQCIKAWADAVGEREVTHWAANYWQ